MRQRWRNYGQVSGSLQQFQLPTPVRQRPAQPFQTGMPRANLHFECRDLRAAASRSFRCPLPFRADFIERPPVAVELGFLAGQRLPALNDDIHVLRI